MKKFAVMFDLGHNSTEKRRYILGVEVGTSIEERTKTFEKDFRDIQCLREGYKEIPMDTDNVEFLQDIQKRYPGAPGNGKSGILCYSGENRPMARRLLENEDFTID